MPDLTIIYWRDIPAQILVRAGRQVAKRELPLRFTEAIDMAAMRSGAKDGDAYLEAWRRSTPVPVEGDPDAAAESARVRLEDDYPAERLKRLVDNGGREP